MSLTIQEIAIAGLALYFITKSREKKTVNTNINPVPNLANPTDFQKDQWEKLHGIGIFQNGQQTAPCGLDCYGIKNTNTWPNQGAFANGNLTGLDAYYGIPRGQDMGYLQ